MSDKPIENPTWYGEISKMFNQEDIDHMAPQGVRLDNYDYVKDNAAGIYGQVASGNMPPGEPWSSEWVDTFLDWMKNGYPKGTIESINTTFMGLKSMEAKSAGRIRKEITELSSDELDKLKKAFKTIMEMDHTQEGSYFTMAGWHGLPKRTCMHHIPAYNPWHRAYLYYFENGLRQVEGCEDVTLPYWDISQPIPDVLKQPPFDSYTLPVSLNSYYRKGYKTSRNSTAEYESRLRLFDVLADLSRAMGKTDWEDFHGGRAFDNALNNTNISGHDGGHSSIGPTMSDQDVASFDPIFWFFHCNLDRLWWKWQKSMQATDKAGLIKTIRSDNSRNIFEIPPLTTLNPFTNMDINRTTVNVIDSVNDLDIDYDMPATEKVKPLETLSVLKGSTDINEDFKVQPDRVNVRVKDLNRIKIPGTFAVHLTKDGEIIKSKAFFQPNEAEKCENCIENKLINIDFEVPLETVKEGKLGIKVEPMNKQKFGDAIPHKVMGNPTMNIRMLLSTDTHE